MIKEPIQQQGLAEQLFGERRQRRKDAVGVGARNKEREITYIDFRANGKGKRFFIAGGNAARFG